MKNNIFQVKFLLAALAAGCVGQNMYAALAQGARGVSKALPRLGVRTSGTEQKVPLDPVADFRKQAQDILKDSFVRFMERTPDKSTGYVRQMLRYGDISRALDIAFEESVAGNPNGIIYREFLKRDLSNSYDRLKREMIQMYAPGFKSFIEKQAKQDIEAAFMKELGKKPACWLENANSIEETEFVDRALKDQQHAINVISDFGKLQDILRNIKNRVITLERDQALANAAADKSMKRFARGLAVATGVALVSEKMCKKKPVVRPNTIDEALDARAVQEYQDTQNQLNLERQEKMAAMHKISEYPMVTKAQLSKELPLAKEAIKKEEADAAARQALLEEIAHNPREFIPYDYLDAVLEQRAICEDAIAELEKERKEQAAKKSDN